MRVALALICLMSFSGVASAQLISPSNTAEPKESTGRTVSPETKGQLQPQGWTGPINTESGGAPAESPQGQTPPGMQAAPEGSSKTVVEPTATPSRNAVAPTAAPSQTVAAPTAAPARLPPVGSADEAAKDAIGTTAGGAKIPTVEEARAAKMMPYDPNPVPGQPLQPAQQVGGADKPAAAPGSADPTTATAGQAAVGGPMSPGASAGGENSKTPGGASQGGQPSNPAVANASGPAGIASTTGARPVVPADTRPGPIGATGQTMPSRLSQRNAILDHVPIMAMPLALTEPQRQRIYETVMADKSRQPAADAESLAPATSLSTEQALNEAQPIPDSLKDIELLKGLQYLKAKDKVLLITPASRIVIDAITM